MTISWNRRWTRVAALAAVLAATAVSGSAAACGSRTYAPHLEPARADDPAEVVVLLHGQGRTARSMTGLAERLAGEGYRAVVWDYESTAHDVETHGRWLEARLAVLDRDPRTLRIHLVTHSLGGIVTRQALRTRRPAKLGRVVQLAPPNRGSASARRWSPLLGGVLRCLPQLSDDPDSFVNRMEAPAGFEVGVVAGRYDGKVPVESTHLPDNAEADHLIVPAFHTFIMDRQDVFDAIRHFLTHGRFPR